MKVSIFVALFLVVIGVGAVVYLNWYTGLPVVKKTPDGTVVGVEIEGECFGPEYKKGLERYIVQWVSHDWEPEEKE